MARTINPMFRSVSLIVCSGIFALSCKSQATESGAATTAAATAASVIDAGARIGIAGCDSYVAKVEACFAKDEKLKAQREASFNHLKAGWTRAAATNRDAVIFSCEEALKSLAVTMPTCK